MELAPAPTGAAARKPRDLGRCLGLRLRPRERLAGLLRQPAQRAHLRARRAVPLGNLGLRVVVIGHGGNDAAGRRRRTRAVRQDRLRASETAAPADGPGARSRPAKRGALAGAGGPRQSDDMTGRRHPAGCGRGSRPRLRLVLERPALWLGRRASVGAPCVWRPHPSAAGLRCGGRRHALTAFHPNRFPRHGSPEPPCHHPQRAGARRHGPFPGFPNAMHARSYRRSCRPRNWVDARAGSRSHIVVSLSRERKPSTGSTEPTRAPVLTRAPLLAPRRLSAGTSRDRRGESLASPSSWYVRAGIRAMGAQRLRHLFNVEASQ